MTLPSVKVIAPGLMTVKVKPAGTARVLVAQGPGPAGAGYLAAVALSGHRVVAVIGGQLVYADPGSAGHKLSVVGITPGAANAGEIARPVSAGQMDEPGWAWVPGLPVYAGTLGTLTQTPPGPPGWLRIVGVAQTSTRLLVAMREPITQGE